MSLSSFEKIVKRCLAHLPKDDYPALDTCKFVSTWISFVLDQSQTSMRSMIQRLNIGKINVNLSTFSKASKNRSPEIFKNLWLRLQKEANKIDKRGEKIKDIFPLDSTIISLTSKLLWQQEIYQVKLFSGINLTTQSPDGILLHFGQGHDSKYGDETIDATPENGVSVMDRGFCKLKRIKQLQENKNTFFVLRLKNNMKLNPLENGKYEIGTGKDRVVERVVIFCDLEKGTEFRFVTNLPEDGEFGVSNEEIAEIYRLRWQIELLWKFLKMHLKLDRIITKNVNGIEIQIYCSLISYSILKLVKTPEIYGTSLLDKLRYLQAFMCQKMSYVHWFEELVRC